MCELRKTHVTLYYKLWRESYHVLSRNSLVIYCILGTNSVVRFVLYIIHVARHLYDIMSVIIYMILRVQLVNACNGLATQLDTDSPSEDLV